MAFLHNYLLENEQTIDFSYAEDDEAALVLFLLYARLNGSAENLQFPPDFRAPEDLPAELSSPAEQRELKFVTTFLCFFIIKPAAYMRDIANFREYFIPGFAGSTDKQILLASLLRARFFRASINDIGRAPSLNLFMDATKIPILA